MTKNRKYTFKRWFKHLVAFNKVAFEYRSWKPKYLFHDIDKPIINLFKSNHDTHVYHRLHSKHHVEYPNIHKQDYEAMAIDWECARYTKPEKQLDAYHTYLTHYKDIMTVTQRVNFMIALNNLNKRKYKLR